MADPVTLGTMAVSAIGSSGAASAAGAVGMGSSILGSLFKGIGAVQSGEAQSGQMKYQAGIALLNSQIMSQNSEYALNTGEQTAMRYGMKSGQQQGAIVAAQASSGVDVNSGSNKQVQESAKHVAQMDMTQIRADAAKTAYDYRVQSNNYRLQAGLYMMGAQNAEAAIPINVASSLVGGAESVSSKWMQGKSMGLWGS